MPPGVTSLDVTARAQEPVVTSTGMPVGRWVTTCFAGGSPARRRRHIPVAGTADLDAERLKYVYRPALASAIRAAADFMAGLAAAEIPVDAARMHTSGAGAGDLPENNSANSGLGILGIVQKPAC